MTQQLPWEVTRFRNGRHGIRYDDFPPPVTYRDILGLPVWKSLMFKVVGDGCQKLAYPPLPQTFADLFPLEDT